MPLKLIHRGAVWHITGTYQGVRVRQSTGETERARAQAVLDATQNRIFQQVTRGEAAPRPFGEAVIGYLDSGGSPRFLDKVIAAFGDTPVREIGQADLDRAARQAYPTAKPSTLNRQFYTPFAAVMAWAIDEGWRPPRKWRRPEQPEGRVDWRTPQEMEAFILAAPWHVARNVIIYLGSIMRASEGVNLDRADTAPDGSQITLWDTKGGYPRKVEVLARAAPLVAEVQAGPIIRTDDPYHPGYHAYDAVNQSIERVCDRHGLPRFSLHVLRHTGATWRLALDSDIPRLMANGGWKSVAMAMRYAHVSTRGLADDLEKFGWHIADKRNGS